MGRGRPAPLRLVEQAVAKDDPDLKALACDGVLVRWAHLPAGWPEEVWLRFVPNRPVSTATAAYLAWCCDQPKQDHFTIPNYAA